MVWTPPFRQLYQGEYIHPQGLSGSHSRNCVAPLQRRRQLSGFTYAARFDIPMDVLPVRPGKHVGVREEQSAHPSIPRATGLLDRRAAVCASLENHDLSQYHDQPGFFLRHDSTSHRVFRRPSPQTSELDWIWAPCPLAAPFGAQALCGEYGWCTVRGGYDGMFVF